MMQRLLVSVLVVVLASGCGWRLRGSLALPPGLERVAVTAPDQGHLFDRRLADMLVANGVTVTDQPADAQLVIRLGELEESRRVVTTGGNTLATEYELKSELSYSVTGGDGQVLVDNATVTSLRSYEFDQNDVVGKAEEERLIQREMQRDLVEQIVRRLRFLETDTADGARG